MLSPSLETVRLFLHVLAAAVWVGGQVVLAGLVPTLRRVGPEAPRAAARAFARVAWPAFAVVVATGIWNVAASDVPATDASYAATLGVKVLLVAAAGLAAWFHGATTDRRLVGVTGALAAAASIAALFLGVLLVAPA